MLFAAMAFDFEMGALNMTFPEMGLRQNEMKCEIVLLGISRQEGLIL